MESVLELVGRKLEDKETEYSSNRQMRHQFIELIYGMALDANQTLDANHCRGDDYPVQRREDGAEHKDNQQNEEGCQRGCIW